MSLEKTIVVDKIEVLETGVIQVREAHRVYEDGKFLSQSFQRYCVAPGNDYSQRDPKVQQICQVTHTPEVIAKYQELIAE